MSVWKELKKVVNSDFSKPLDTLIEEKVKNVLNSTYGTTDFQPLDEIIKNQRMFVPSNSVILTYSGTSLYKGDNAVTIGTFIPAIDGNINIDVFGSAVNGNITKGVLTLYKGDTEVAVINNIASANDSTYSLNNVNVTRGATYTFKFSVVSGGMSGSTSVRISYITLKADIVDKFLFAYTQEV